jgi:threonine synthase
MRFYSTHNPNKIVANSFEEVLFEGQAQDKGLFMPESIPILSKEEIEKMAGMSYPEIAFEVMSRFLKDEIKEEDLKRIIDQAYDFEVPIEIAGDNRYIMRLDQGPTASFKDFAARIMSRLMAHFKWEGSKDIFILTATSGDTGSAVASAYSGIPGFKVALLFPKYEVSERQRKQMTTLDGNITAIEVDGKFDDCQRLVKQAFADPDLNYLNLSSANSINFGRLLPQACYYFYAYSRVVKKDDEKIVFCVPSGNFGNIMAGVLAGKMGLPIYRFVAAVNDNDQFTKFLQAGAYVPTVPSKQSISNAMNVGHSSNLVRLIDLYGGQMNEKGEIMRMPIMEELQNDIISISVTDDETKEAMKGAFKKGILLEPHGGVAWHALSEVDSILPKESKKIA